MKRASLFSFFATGIVCTFAGIAACAVSSPQVNAASTYDVIVRDCTWNEAFNDCLERGGHLARIDDEDEFWQIVNLLDTDPKWSSKVFFLGGRRELDDYGYYWADDWNELFGTPVNAKDHWSRQYWGPGEPSFQYGNAIENCMTIFRYRGSWILNDDPEDPVRIAPEYSGIIGYICEYENHEVEAQPVPPFYPQQPAPERASILKGNIVKLGSEFVLDLDGNGYEETIRLEAKDGKDGNWRAVPVHVDNESADWYTEYPDTSLYGVSLDGKNILLIAYDHGPSDDPVCTFFRYTGGDLEEVGVIEDAPDKISTLSGIIYAWTPSRIIEATRRLTQWKMDRGYIQMIEQDVYPLQNLNPQGKRVKGSIYVYNDRNERSGGSYLKSQGVQFPFTDGERWVYVLGDSGQSGWFPAGDYSTGELNSLFAGLQWAD